ncbi:hypothetical protein [uncultured Porphyromonas sp.]|uniref:hypothetical protein n=1 Tax=uncultured Porphyromonas sp. TaxID=159274 RepID=UPI00259A1D24|nr:hypothetical protein [uncultured Porphyromonas sp.]
MFIVAMVFKNSFRAVAALCVSFLILSSCANDAETPFDSGDGDAYLTLDVSNNPEFLSFCKSHANELAKEGLYITSTSEVSIKVKLPGFTPESSLTGDRLTVSNNDLRSSLVLRRLGSRYVINAEDFFSSMDGVADCCYDRLRGSSKVSSESKPTSDVRTIGNGSGGSAPGDGSPKVPETGVDGMRCIDYNGKWGDGENYPRNDPRALKNFIGSDCYKAVRMGHCLMEHISSEKSCYSAHGGKICSEFLK